MSHNEIIMRSKNILSIAAFVTAFVVSAVVASLFVIEPAYTLSGSTNHNYTPYCRFKRKNSTAAAITTLIANDHANGRVRSSGLYELNESYPPSYNSVAFADYAENVENYVDASSDMATDNLPNDFKSAWREHMKAWRDYSKFLNKSANISRKNPLTEEEFNEAENRYDAEISRTWTEVLEIGANYGADVY